MMSLPPRYGREINGKSQKPTPVGKINLFPRTGHDTFCSMKRAAGILATAFLLLSAGTAQALQIKDVDTSLTRVRADKELTKDYKYRVLQDMAVRRTWMVNSDCRVSLDFDTSNGKLIFVLVEYKGGVDKDRVDDDTETILQSTDIKWKKLAKNKQGKYGVKNARVAKASNGFYIFQEYNKKKKCVRLMMTAAHPEENRRDMQDASDAAHVTALGSTAGGSVVKQIKQDEERRLRMPNQASKAAPEPKAENPVKEPKKPTTLPKEPEPDVMDEDTVDDADGVLVSEEISPMEWLEEHGIDQTRLIQIGGGVAGLILLLTIIGYVRRRAAQKRILQRVQELRQGTEADDEDDSEE